MESSVYICRRTDGKIARLDLDMGVTDDVWSALERAAPVTNASLDPEEVLGVNCRDVDRIDDFFNAGWGEDVECAEWLRECEARVVELDELGRVTGVIASFEGVRDWAVDRAVDAATAYIENSAVDTSEFRVEVRVGEDAVWEWDDGEGSE